MSENCPADLELSPRKTMTETIWIPNYGATAAAVNTLISYVIFLIALALVGRSGELARGAQPKLEAIG